MILNIETRRSKKIKKLTLEEEKINRLLKPHKWFAWFPVRVSEKEVAFLTYVTRTGIVSSTWNTDVGWFTPKITGFTYSL